MKLLYKPIYRSLRTPLGRKLVTLGIASFALFLATVCSETGQDFLGEAALNLTDPSRAQRLEEISDIAVKLENETGYPANVLIAQWAVESRWGEHPSCHSNYFGIKFNPTRNADSCWVDTAEAFSPAELQGWNRSHPDRLGRVLRSFPDGSMTVAISDQFAEYASLEDSSRDYVALIENAPPYRTFWKKYLDNHDAMQLLSGVAREYATNPEYARTLTSVATGWTVRGAVTGARRRAAE